MLKKILEAIVDLSKWQNTEELKNLLHKEAITLLERRQWWLHHRSHWFSPINGLSFISEEKIVERLSRWNLIFFFLVRLELRENMFTVIVTNHSYESS